MHVFPDRYFDCTPRKIEWIRTAVTRLSSLRRWAMEVLLVHDKWLGGSISVIEDLQLITP